jgi:hypothetical protein
MTSERTTAQIGRLIIGQLEQEPKYESGIQLEGYRAYDPWARQRLARHLEVLAERGFIEREPSGPGVRTLGKWRPTALGLESRTRQDFLADDALR